MKENERRGKPHPKTPGAASAGKQSRPVPSHGLKRPGADRPTRPLDKGGDRFPRTPERGPDRHTRPLDKGGDRFPRTPERGPDRFTRPPDKEGDRFPRTPERGSDRPMRPPERGPSRPMRPPERGPSRPIRPLDKGRDRFTRPPDRKTARPSEGARRAALEVLNRVFIREGFASLSLDELFSQVHLSPVDRRLCAAIVYGTLENLYRIDFALHHFLDDPGSLPSRLHSLLRLSACQILQMDRIPDSAVVNEAVKLARATGLDAYAGLVNAVLRNLIRGRDEIPWPSREEGARYLSVMGSAPLWLVEKILLAYGPEDAERILFRRRESPWITIRPNLMRMTEERFEQILAKKVWKAEKGLMPNAWRIRGAANIARDSDFMAGSFSIQGEGSMVAAEAVGVRVGMQVLDCCAAPGGKAAYLAEKMQGTGRVFAWDIHPHRVELIKASAERLRLYNIRPAVRDALVDREQQHETMDAVLIDAPCTGLGVMDDKPDIKYRTTPESLSSLLETQKELLAVNSRYVKPGGTLVYATCSILPEENGQQVEAFLRANPQFVVEGLPPCVPETFRKWETPLGLQL